MNVTYARSYARSYVLPAVMTAWVRHEQALNNLRAVTSPHHHATVMAELDRRGTSTAAAEALYLELVLGAYVPFTPLDLTVEQRRLAAWDARQAELRRRWPKAGAPASRLRGDR